MALGHMLKSDFEIHFVCKRVPESIINEIEEFGFLFLSIKKEKEFFSVLTGKEIVILDHYELDSVYQKKIKEIGCKLVCIDDLHDQEFYADLIINHDPCVKPIDYKAQSYTQFALGLDYALLRPLFLAQASNERLINCIETVFICFGGSDFKNLTLRVLEEVSKFDSFEKIIVVTGNANNHIKQLETFIKLNNRIEHYHAVDERKMLELMLESELAIVPASGILLESIALGCKIISGMYADNQKHIFSSFKEYGCFISAESFGRTDIISSLNQVINEKIIQLKIIDGKSDMRIRNKFSLWN